MPCPRAESALAEALHAAGFDTLDAARAAHLTRSEAASRLKEAEATQRALAPDGREALVAKLDALPAAPADAEGTEADRSGLEAEQAEAQQALTQAQATVTKARHTQASAQVAAQLARARAEAALSELERTAQVLGDNATARATLAELEADPPKADRGCAQRPGRGRGAFGFCPRSGSGACRSAAGPLGAGNSPGAAAGHRP